MGPSPAMITVSMGVVIGGKVSSIISNGESMEVVRISWNHYIGWRHSMGRESHSDICSNCLMSSGGQPKVGLRYEGICRLAAVTCSPFVRIWGLWWGHFLVIPWIGFMQWLGSSLVKFTATGRMGKAFKITRCQYAMTARYAFTDYKSQGQTIEYIIIDIGKPPTGTLYLFSAYVVLSWSRGRDTIQLLRDFNNNLFRNHPSKALRREMTRLEALNDATREWEGWQM